MNRKGLIISLIVSLISLAYLILAYTGVIRRIQIRNGSLESYLKSFPDIPKAKDRVIVVFSPSEKELENLTPFLNSILDQTVRVHDIVLITPYKNMGKVPEQVKKNFSVRGHSKDYKDANKLVCSVLTEPDAETKVILVEPNVIYDQDFVEKMISSSEKNPDKVVYGSAEKNVKSGILFKPKFFDNKITEYDDKSDCCSWLDKCCKSKGVVAS